eukprot:Nk52_evm3s226 gene=Nk52_evmTU3s226
MTGKKRKSQKKPTEANHTQTKSTTKTIKSLPGQANKEEGEEGEGEEDTTEPQKQKQINKHKNQSKTPFPIGKSHKNNGKETSRRSKSVDYTSSGPNNDKLARIDRDLDQLDRKINQLLVEQDTHSWESPLHRGSTASYDLFRVGLEDKDEEEEQISRDNDNERWRGRNYKEFRKSESHSSSLFYNEGADGSRVGGESFLEAVSEEEGDEDQEEEGEGNGGGSTTAAAHHMASSGLLFLTTYSPKHKVRRIIRRDSWRDYREPRPSVEDVLAGVALREVYRQDEQCRREEMEKKKEEEEECGVAGDDSNVGVDTENDKEEMSGDKKKRKKSVEGSGKGREGMKIKKMKKKKKKGAGVGESVEGKMEMEGSRVVWLHSTEMCFFLLHLCVLLYAFVRLIPLRVAYVETGNGLVDAFFNPVIYLLLRHGDHSDRAGDYGDVVGIWHVFPCVYITVRCVIAALAYFLSAYNNVRPERNDLHERNDSRSVDESHHHSHGHRQRREHRAEMIGCYALAAVHLGIAWMSAVGGYVLYGIQKEMSLSEMIGLRLSLSSLHHSIFDLLLNSPVMICQSLTVLLYTLLVIVVTCSRLLLAMQSFRRFYFFSSDSRRGQIQTPFETEQSHIDIDFKLCQNAIACFLLNTSAFVSLVYSSRTLRNLPSALMSPFLRLLEGTKRALWRLVARGIPASVLKLMGWAQYNAQEQYNENSDPVIFDSNTYKNSNIDDHIVRDTLHHYSHKHFYPDCPTALQCAEPTYHHLYKLSTNQMHTCACPAAFLVTIRAETFFSALTKIKHLLYQALDGVKSLLRLDIVFQTCANIGNARTATGTTPTITSSGDLSREEALCILGKWHVYAAMCAILVLLCYGCGLGLALYIHFTRKNSNKNVKGDIAAGAEENCSYEVRGGHERVVSDMKEKE